LAGEKSTPVIIDLHTCSVAEALETFRKAYQEQVRSPSPHPLEVVHGYGSGGQGGVIRTRLRAYLRNQGTRLVFLSGEQVDGNPGYTLVYPKMPLPAAEDVLGEDILSYCSTSRSEERIAGRFRRYGEPAVLTTLKSLENQGRLSVEYKGKYKCYRTA
jgi:hypothetical protein